MAMTLVRRGAHLGRVVASSALAVPLVVVAGLSAMAADPLLHAAGVNRGSLLEVAATVGISAGIGYAAARILGHSPAARSIHQRGTMVEDREARSHQPARVAESAWVSLSSRRPDRSNQSTANREAITLAGVAVAPLDETKHFKIIGTTGTGKSTAIRELLSGALARGDRAIIADPDGGYLARFRDESRGDVILNPFDRESRKWDLFAEIDSPYDIDQLARSLLPDQGGPDKSWISYARTFFSSVTRQAHEAGVTDLRELYDLLVVADTSELRTLLAGTPAQPFLEQHNGRMFDSIRSVTSSAVGSLDYIAQQTGPALSIRRWVREGAHGPGTEPDAASGGVLFIPYKAGQIAALRSTVSAWMRLAIFEAMSQPEGDQRLWFVVDELDALGQIDGLKDALARLRKFGGRCVLGFQSVAQVSATYGSGEAQTLVENCGNTLILRCSGSDHGGTAHFASHLIGQREVVRTSRSHSRHPTDFLSSTTISEHVAIEPAVMDSQIEQLPDLVGYLKFASVPAWRRVTLAAPDEPTSGVARFDASSAWRRWRAGAASAGGNTAGGSATRGRPGSMNATVGMSERGMRDGADYE